MNLTSVSMKKAKIKRLLAILFPLYNIIEKAKLWEQRSYQSLPRAGDIQRGLTPKKQTELKEDFESHEDVLYLVGGSDFTVTLQKNSLKCPP